MNTTLRAAGIAALGLASTALLVSPANAAAGHHPSYRHAGSPVFVQTDNTSGNSIVAYDRAGDGRLAKAGTYPTGGLGGVLTGSAVDHLASEGSLTYDRAAHLLYAVNAGSNTITSFAVDGDRLTRRQVISSGGTFPVSITVHGDRVYVLNARDGGSIQGYLQAHGVLVAIHSWNRSLGLDPTLTPEFTNTPGQIAFTPDGSQLVVTTKAASNSIDVFAVDAFGPSAKPVVNTEGSTVPFGITFDRHGNLAVAEAGPNAVATFRVNKNGKVTALHSAATGQAATCWIISVKGKLYASNAGSGTLSGYQEGTHGSLSALATTTTDGGTVDATVSGDGHFVYVQTGATGTVDAFRRAADGSLTAIGSVTVPGAVGGEGIVAL